MRKLRKPQFVPDSISTKSKILLVAARLFAVYGYSTVSMRDIADATGVRAASLYSHFEGKQTILDSIMDMCVNELHVYYGMLDRLTAEADSFEQMLRNMLAESMEVVNPFCYYALFTASTNQFLFESCRRVYFHFYFEEGHEATSRQLETVIARGLVPPFDTQAVSSLIMNCVLNLVSITVGRLNGHYEDFDIKGWYDMTINHILAVTKEAVGV